MAAIHVTDHNLLSPPSPRSFQLMAVIEAAVKVFANIFLRLNYFPECIPQSGMTFFPPVLQMERSHPLGKSGQTLQPSAPGGF